jgi:hypothetical protein
MRDDFSATSRKLTREEQDKVNKTRKSVRATYSYLLSHVADPFIPSTPSQLMQYTSVRVTPEAQRAYLAAHPDVAARVQQERAKESASANPAREPLKTKKRNANEAQLDQAHAHAGPSKPMKQVKA